MKNNNKLYDAYSNSDWINNNLIVLNDYKDSFWMQLFLRMSLI